jgi:hypothetical protein
MRWNNVPASVKMADGRRVFDKNRMFGQVIA